MLEMIELPLELVCRETFDSARTEHGDLGLTMESFAAKLERVIQSHPTRLGSGPDLASCRIQSLHTSDLYLSLSCAAGRNAALDALHRFIRQIHRSSRRRRLRG